MLKSDKVRHFLLCFLITLGLGWTYGLTVGVTVELTQAEHGNADVKTFFKRLTSKDTILDLVADLVGVLIGLTARAIV